MTGAQQCKILHKKIREEDPLSTRRALRYVAAILETRKVGIGFACIQIIGRFSKALKGGALKKVFVILMIGVVGLVVSCQVEYPEPPELILPEDGITFQNQVPAFIWNSVDGQGEYIIKITKNLLLDKEVLVEDTVEDTSYTLPYAIYTAAENGTCAWSVAYLGENGEPSWSASRTFTIENSKNIEKTVSELLYDSYFPMDTGYEWVYKTTVIGWWGMDDWWIEDVYTVSVKIDSITKLENDWVKYYLNNDYFIDVGKEVKTNGVEISIFNDSVTISTQTYLSERNYFEIERVKGVGVVYQYSYYENYIYFDSLKFFRKGDTIWRYP